MYWVCLPDVKQWNSLVHPEPGFLILSTYSAVGCCRDEFSFPCPPNTQSCSSPPLMCATIPQASFFIGAPSASSGASTVHLRVDVSSSLRQLCQQPRCPQYPPYTTTLLPTTVNAQQYTPNGGDPVVCFFCHTQCCNVYSTSYN